MEDKFAEAVERSVRQGVSAGVWRRYRNYRMKKAEDGDVWATAVLPPRWREGYCEEERKSVQDASPILYSPLTEAKDLFVRFADMEPTEEAWRTFLLQYGTLGRDPERDKLSRFIEEVRRARRVLTLYEAGTAKPADVKAIAGVFVGAGTKRDTARWAKDTGPVEASRLALGQVDFETRQMLREETFADLFQGGQDEQLHLSYGFHSLLGAAWLQFAFLRASQRGPLRCQAPDCSNPLDVGTGGKKAVYKNKRFCSNACAERDRYARKKWSRTLSRSDDAS
jgi:hypothetical protein